MNLRWTVLAEECWEERVNEWHFDQEKFARLIVEECAHVANDHNEEAEGAHLGVGNAIKYHFGVNE